MRTRLDRPTPMSMGIAGIVICLLAALGIDAITRSIPASYAGTPDASGIVGLASASVGPGDARAGESRTDLGPAQAATDRRKRDRCPECGVVESMRRTAPSEAAGGQDNVDLDRPASAPAGAAAADAAAAGGYEITIRFRDGSRTVFNEASPRDWRPGSRVIVIGRANPSGE